MASKESSVLKLLQSEEGKIEIVQRWFVPPLTNPEWADQFEVDEKEMEKSRRALAEYYIEIGDSFFSYLALALVPVLLIDYVATVPPMLYGLVVNIAAAAMIAYPALKGPAMISSIVNVEDRKPIRDLHARQTVYHNTGFVLLLLGFGLQIVALLLVPDGQVIDVNLLAGDTLGLMKGGLLFLSLILFYKLVVTRLLG